MASFPLIGEIIGTRVRKTIRHLCFQYQSADCVQEYESSRYLRSFLFAGKTPISDIGHSQAVHTAEHDKRLYRYLICSLLNSFLFPIHS